MKNLNRSPLNGKAGKLHTLHPNCVACRSRAAMVESGLNGEQAALTLLGMLRGGHALDAVYRDLCFRHRRMVDDTAAAVARGDSGEEKTR